MIKEEFQEDKTKDNNLEGQKLGASYMMFPSGQRGALLDMLAEVASQTLLSGTTPTTLKPPSPPPPCPAEQQSVQPTIHKIICPSVPGIPIKFRRKRPPQRKVFLAETGPMSLQEICGLPLQHLVKFYSYFDCNELKRTFSFTCTLEPEVCSETFSSFGSEVKARKQVLAHLKEHLKWMVQGFNRDKDKRPVCTVEAVTIETPPSNEVSKTMSVQIGEEEHADVSSEERTLMVEIIKQRFTENQDSAEKPSSTNLPRSRSEKAREKMVQFDHCYTQYIESLAEDRVEIVNADESDPVANGSKSENSIKKELTPDNFLVSKTLNDTIMVCVMKQEQLPFGSYEEDIALPDNIFAAPEVTVETSKPLELPKTKKPLKETAKFTKSIQERLVKKKPKGKAKFIGQSSVDQALAIQMIERIRCRQASILESLECRICNPPRTFTAPTTLLSHYRSHAGIKPFECMICRAAFTRQHSLNYHLLIHSNETRFTCEDCGRKFRHPSHFKEHQRRHTGESPFECEKCSTRFKTRNTYKRHLKTRHGQVLTATGELSTIDSPVSIKPRGVKRLIPTRQTMQPSAKSPRLENGFLVPFDGTFEEVEPESSEEDTLEDTQEPKPEIFSSIPTTSTTTTKNENKEDIVQQAMRSSEIDFESDNEEMLSVSQAQISLNHFAGMTQAFMTKKPENVSQADLMDAAQKLLRVLADPNDKGNQNNVCVENNNNSFVLKLDDQQTNGNHSEIDPEDDNRINLGDTIVTFQCSSLGGSKQTSGGTIGNPGSNITVQLML